MNKYLDETDIKLVMTKLIGAKHELEYFCGLHKPHYIKRALRDIERAMQILCKNEGGDGE